MYTDKSAGKGIGLKQIVSIAVIAVCILTMLLPWVYVGMKSTDGDNWDMNSLLEDFTDLDVEDYLDILTDNDYLFDALSPATARKEIKVARNAITGIANAIKDSKLSSVEMASIFTNLAILQNFFMKYDDDYAFSISKNTFLSIGAVQWLIILAFVVLGAYCIFADLTGRKSPFLAAMCVYLVLFLLYALVAIYGNSVAKKHLGDSILLEFAGIRNPSFLYIQFAPILGSILIIGNFVFWKVNPTGSLSMVSTGIETISKNSVWRCACGATNPSSSRFCPRCGKERPADFSTMDSRAADRPGWTCSCGHHQYAENCLPAPAEAQIPKRARSVQNAAQSGRLISPPRSLRIPRTLHIPLNLHMPRGLRTPRTPRMPRSLRVPQTPHIPLILRTRLPQSPIARDAVSP